MSNRFNKPINRDSITEFWEKWKQDKYQNPTETMLEVIKEQLSARELGKGQLSDTEKELLFCLAEALLETQTNRNFSKMNRRNFSTYAKNP